MSTMRKWLGLLTGLALIAGACSNSSSEPTDGSTTTAAAPTETTTSSDVSDTTPGDLEPIKIGVVLSITGDASSLGVPEADTVALYAEELGVAAGRPVEWIVLDDGSDQSTAVVLVKQLIDSEQVAGIICCTTSPITLSLIDSAQRAGVPMISLGAAASIANPVEEREWIFKTAVPDTIIARIIAEHMKAQGFETVGLLFFDDGYGESGREQFAKVAEDVGLTITGEQGFPRTATDVTAEAAQLVTANPDAYLIWATPPGAVIAERDLRSLGAGGAVYQSHGAANRTFIELGGADVEGTFLGVPKLIVASNLPDSDPQKSVILAYQTRYEADHGAGSINVFGSEGLDAMIIMHSALEQAAASGSTDLVEFRRRLRDEIERISGYVGITGIYAFSSSDHEGLDTRCCTIVQVQDGNWVPAP